MRSSTPITICCLLSILGLCSIACNGGGEEEAAPEVTMPVAEAETDPCTADASWVTSPSIPTVVPDQGNTICDFYQFGWQYFMYLVSPSATPETPNFEDASQFPILLTSGDSCATQPDERTFFVRTTKPGSTPFDVTLPERIGQAGGGDTIYDRNNNVVYYDIRFKRDPMCAISNPPPTTGDLPVGSAELKTAWRILDPDQDDVSSYYAVEATIEGAGEPGTPQLLGLIAFHLATSTPQHPEMVWLTWEHQSNAPDCVDPQAAPANGWSFTSSSGGTDCVACLANPTQACFDACAYNQAQPATSLTGTPTQICRVWPDGTDPSDNKAAENVADVDALNQAMTGPGGLIATQGGADVSVFQNYFNVGGLWLNQPAPPAAPVSSSDTAELRGSLQLADSVMETTFQGDLSFSSGSIERQPASANCFGCHHYNSGDGINGLSHIVDYIHTGLQ